MYKFETGYFDSRYFEFETDFEFGGSNSRYFEFETDFEFDGSNSRYFEFGGSNSRQDMLIQGISSSVAVIRDWIC